MGENEPQWFANRNMQALTLSWPCALFGSRFAIILNMSSSVILTEDSLSFAL